MGMDDGRDRADLGSAGWHPSFDAPPYLVCCQI